MHTSGIHMRRKASPSITNPHSVGSENTCLANPVFTGRKSFFLPDSYQGYQGISINLINIYLQFMIHSYNENLYNNDS